MNLASFTHAQQCLLITASTKQNHFARNIGLSYSTLKHKGLVDFPDVSKDEAIAAFEQLKAQGVVVHRHRNLITPIDSIQKLFDEIYAQYQAESAGQ